WSQDRRRAGCALGGSCTVCVPLSPSFSSVCAILLTDELIVFPSSLSMREELGIPSRDATMDVDYDVHWPFYRRNCTRPSSGLYCAATSSPSSGQSSPSRIKNV